MATKKEIIENIQTELRVNLEWLKDSVEKDYSYMISRYYEAYITVNRIASRAGIISQTEYEANCTLGLNLLVYGREVK